MIDEKEFDKIKNSVKPFSNQKVKALEIAIKLYPFLAIEDAINKAKAIEKYLNNE